MSRLVKVEDAEAQLGPSAPSDRAAVVESADRHAVVEWFEQQLHAAEDSGRCPREQWLPWDPRRLAGLLSARSSPRA